MTAFLDDGAKGLTKVATQGRSALEVSHNQLTQGIDDRRGASREIDKEFPEPIDISVCCGIHDMHIGLRWDKAHDIFAQHKSGTVYGEAVASCIGAYKGRFNPS